MKLKFKTAFIIIFMSLSTVFYGQNNTGNKSIQDDEISYLITVDKNNQKVAKVEVSFSPKDSILYMSSGAYSLPKRWATFVHNVKVFNTEGKSITVEELSDAKWKMHTSLNEKLILTYDVHLDHEDFKWSSGIDGVAYSNELGVFYTGRTLFILNGKERKDIYIDFKLNNDWGITTPWNKKDEGSNTFKANGISDLVDAMIFVGNHKEISFKRDDFELIFALGSEDIIAQEEEFRSLANGVLDYYIDLFGGIPKSKSDSPFSKTVVVISSSDATDGEVVGNNISVLIEKNAGQFSKTISRFIFAHEFFHLWNGKSFSPINEDTEWFKEGFTNYYTIKALHHIGFLNDESYLDVLSNFFYQRYNSDNGVGELSMTNGDAKHDHWGLIYGGGMFVGISQDIIIRNATSNQKSIDNLLRGLYKKYGGSNQSYSIEELISEMSELSGIDQTDFFKTYVFGTKKIPIEDYLTMAGLNAQIDQGSLKIFMNEKVNQDQKNLINGMFGKLNRNE